MVSKSLNRKLRSLLPILSILCVFSFFNNCSKVNFTDSSVNPDELNNIRALDNNSIIINNGSPYTNDNQLKVSLTIHSPEALEMYVTNDPSCAHGGEWENYNTNKSWTIQNANQKNEVFAQFKNSKGLSPCISAEILHDNISPTLEISEVPRFTNLTDIKLNYSINESGAGIDRILCNGGLKTNEDKNLNNCTGGYEFKSLTEGDYHWVGTVVDKAGNKSSPINLDFSVDMTKPIIQLNKTPSLITASNQAEFQFSISDKSPTKSMCQFDTENFIDCADSANHNVSDGPHTFSIKAIDEAGNSNIANFNWTVNSKVPTLDWIKTPSLVSNDKNPVIEFRCISNCSNNMTFSCQLNNNPSMSCLSGLNINANSNNTEYIFTVIAKNDLGTSSGSLTYKWKTDFSSPIITITPPPSPTNQDNVNIKFEVVDNNINSISCFYDNQKSDCINLTSFTALQPSEITHNFYITATDKAGNTTTSNTISFLIDRTAPTVTIAGPTDSVSTDANFKITAVDSPINGSGIGKYLCQLDSAPSYSECSSTPKYTLLSIGTHILNVQVTDKANNISLPVSYKWNIKGNDNPPVISFILKPPATLGMNQEAVVQYKVTDDYTSPTLLEIQCGFNNSIAKCSSESTLKFTANNIGTQNFKITATDSSGLTSTQTLTWETKNILQFPTIDSMASLTFEDLYPSPGDADYNDFVTNFKITQNINTKNQITKITIDFYPKAKGAGYNHALLMVLDGEKDLPSNIKVKSSPMFNGKPLSVTLTKFNKDNIKIRSDNISDYSKDVIIFNSTNDLFDSSNTSLSSKYVEAKTKARLEIQVDPTQNLVDLMKPNIDISKYRFVLHVQNSNQDIDVVDVVNSSVDSNGYPYGLIVPTNWRWPTESSNIDLGYSYFAEYRKYLKGDLVTPSDLVLRWFNNSTSDNNILYPTVALPLLLPDP